MAACAIGPKGNLGEQGQNQRLRRGVVASAIAMAVAVIIVKLDLGIAWRLAMFIPFGVAANFVYMGLYKT